MIAPALRGLLLFYFVSHIFCTICLDGQALPFGHAYPRWLKDVLQFHVDTNHDPLMADPPVWFRSLLWCEMVFQLPFFFAASYAFVARKNWIRLPCIIYGAHVCTTLVPIMAEFWAAETLTAPQRHKLMGIYCPWLLLPFVLVVIMLVDERPLRDLGEVQRKRQ